MNTQIICHTNASVSEAMSAATNALIIFATLSIFATEGNAIMAAGYTPHSESNQPYAAPRSASACGNTPRVEALSIYINANKEFWHDGDTNTPSLNLNIRIANESTNGIFVIWTPPPFKIAWSAVRTRSSTYRIVAGRTLLGILPIPKDAIFLEGNPKWIPKCFSIDVPHIASIEPHIAIFTADGLESMSANELGGKVQEEGFISGLVELRCDMAYHVNGYSKPQNACLRRHLLIHGNPKRIDILGCGISDEGLSVAQKEAMGSAMERIYLENIDAPTDEFVRFAN